jgi:hypothetical protein
LNVERSLISRTKKEESQNCAKDAEESMNFRVKQNGLDVIYNAN